MRVGSTPYSAHQAGMSALWHDVDYVPEQRFEIPTVETMLDDMALPNEEHQLPDGVADPFKKLDAVYDVAAAQMERGIKGAAFLNGRPPPMAPDSKAPAQPEAIGQRVVSAAIKNNAMDHKIVDSVRTDLEQVRMQNRVAATTIAKAKTATKTAADAEAEKAPAASSGLGKVGDALSAAATFLPMAAGQAVSSVIQGPLPALATQAITLTSAVLGAGQVAATGIAEGLKEEEPVVVRRGLQRNPKKV